MRSVLPGRTETMIQSADGETNAVVETRRSPGAFDSWNLHLPASNLQSSSRGAEAGSGVMSRLGTSSIHF